jgi:hypothetical protein
MLLRIVSKICERINLNLSTLKAVYIEEVHGGMRISWVNKLVILPLQGILPTVKEILRQVERTLL